MGNPTLLTSGTTGQTAGGGESFVYSTNANGSFVWIVDLNLMAAGDVVELHVYQMTKTGGTSRVAYQMSYYGAQPTDGQIARSPVIETTLTGDTNPIRFSIAQTFGTTRALPYAIVQYT